MIALGLGRLALMFSGKGAFLIPILVLLLIEVVVAMSAALDLEHGRKIAAARAVVLALAGIVATVTGGGASGLVFIIAALGGWLTYTRVGPLWVSVPLALGPWLLVMMGIRMMGAGW